MKRVKQSEAVSRAINASQPSSAKQQGAALQVSSPRKKQTVYFNLCLYDTCDLEYPVEELQAGKTYLLVITCNSHRSSMSKQLKQYICSINDSFSLTLFYDYKSAVTTPITPAKEEFSFDTVFQDEFQYKFTLPAAFPTCQVCLKLTLKTPQCPSPIPAANYTLPVRSQQKAPEMEIFTICQINQRLPEQTAIFLVETVAQQGTEEQRIRLRGWDRAGQTLDEATLIRASNSRDEKKSIIDINSTKRQQLREALLNAFPMRWNLEIMVSEQLNMSLSAITSNSTLEYTVFELIEWARTNGRLKELIIGALRQNRGNLQLRGVAELLGLRNDQDLSGGFDTDKTEQYITNASSVIPFVSIEELQAYRRKQKVGLDPDEILKCLHQFSGKFLPKWRDWLGTLFAAYQEQLNLVIVDLTDLEIPWELLQFKPNCYLGACARVVRWHPIQFFGAHELFIKPSSYAGTVLSYVDQQLRPELIQAEQSALQRLAGQPCPSFDELKKRLTGSLEQVGLIYMSCHGSLGPHLLQENVPELSPMMWVQLFQRTPPLLTAFLNTRESARLMKKGLDNQSSFVSVLLENCASSFVGPLGQVDVRTASSIAEHILLSALQTDGVQIAEELRILRKKEIEHLKLNLLQNENYYRVIDTFMYVYYGNPLARLRLHPRKESEA